MKTPNTTNWDWWLDDIQLTINNTVNSSTGETPHFLLYGVERSMPLSILDDAVQPRSNYTYSDYVSYRTSQAWDIIKKTRDMLKTANKALKNRYDRVSQKPEVKIGQKAYVLRPFKEGPLYKASKKFEGPYRMIEKMKLNKFRLRNIYTKKEKVEHTNYIKVIKHDIDYSFAQDTNDNVSFQDETTGPTHRYALRSRDQQP